VEKKPGSVWSTHAQETGMASTRTLRGL
jgi:hypothetical protein